MKSRLLIGASRGSSEIMPFSILEGRAGGGMHLVANTNPYSQYFHESFGFSFVSSLILSHLPD
jgi:hypothetical protein